MRLLQKLIGRLYTAISADPDAFVALRISHPDGGSWTIAEGVLTLLAGTIPAPQPVTLDLKSHTLRSLAAAINATGWAVADLHPDQRDRGAVCLAEEASSTAAKPAGTLLGHDNPIWALMDSYAVELGEAALVAADAGKQLAITTAEGIWLDEHGSYYGFPRLTGEPDAVYAPRLPQEVLQPKSNNVAMAKIISAAIGQPCTVRDVTIYGPDVPLYDGAIDHDGTYFHDSSALAIYGLFDVEVGFALEGADADIAGLVATITAQVERLRAAGTLLRQVLVSGGELADTAPGPLSDPSDIESLGLTFGVEFAETMAAADSEPLAAAELNLADAADGPAGEEAAMEASFTHTFNGAWSYDGSRPYASGSPLPLTF